MVLDPCFSPFSFEEEYKKYPGTYQHKTKASDEKQIYCLYEFGDLILLNKKQKMAIAMHDHDLDYWLVMRFYTFSETKEIKELEAMDYDECISRW